MTGKLDNPQELQEFCTFRLAERIYGVDILQVKEINEESRITPIHHAPEVVHGYVNIRGSIHLILDLHRMLGLDQTRPGPQNRLVLFKPHVGESFGILVDEIGDVVAVRPGEIEEALPDAGMVPTEEEQNIGRLIKKVCKLKHGLILVVDAAGLLEVVEGKLAHLA